MYLRRKIDRVLQEWKNDPLRKPLIIKGQRQVGKTMSIRHFADENYESVIYLNFVEEPLYKRIIDSGFSAQSIVSNISRIDPAKRFPEHRTILIFDEIQDFIELTTALKFFQLDGRFDVICSGSMLGVNYRRVESVSAGYKTDYEMRSMDFEEFLWAKGYADDLRSDMLQHMLDQTPFTSLEMEIYRILFIDFTILGGLPEIVETYIRKGTFEGTLSRQEQIVRDYREDIMKYAQGMDKSRIVNVFDHIPIQLAKSNKKFQLTSVESTARFRDYRGTIEWLCDAGLIHICHRLRVPELPLKANYDESKYKVYLSDTGLLVSLLDEESQIDLRANQNLGVYKGAIYENMIAEAFVKSGIDLFYYANETLTMEIDFLVRSGNAIIPIEVKSEDGNAKSLRQMVGSDRFPEVAYGIKLANKNIGTTGLIRTFPYFTAFLIKEYLQKQR